jgi:hypothetical protein
MKIEDFKNADSKKILAYIILIVIAILTVIFGFGNKKKEKKADINNMEIETTEKSIYDSKLAAYKDKQKQGENTTIDYNVDMGDYVSKNETYEPEDEEIKRLQESLRQETHTPPPAPAQQKSYSPPTQKINQSISDLKDIVRTELKEEPKKEIKEQEKEPTQTTAPENTKTSETKNSRFYRAEKKRETGNVIAAIVHGQQVVSDGSTLLFRITEDLYTDENILIPKNTYISGIVKLTPQRMEIELQSVKVGKNIFPIKKKVFDTDGLQGLEIDNDTKAKIAKQASASAIESTKTNSSGGNVIGSAASAIGEAAKSVLAKEQREITITVKNNRKIFLQ